MNGRRIVKPRILIIEDEPAILDNIQYALDSEGFETIRLSEGLPALSLLSSEQIDLILLDIGLPDINGIDLCKKIRKTHTTPIIFLTARSAEIDRVVGLEIGGDDYVSKPFSPRELCARVKAVLRRTTNLPAAAPSHPEFDVNDSKRQIHYHGRLLELSKYEYDILATFIRRPGQVYSREQLMERVWDQPETSLDRSVDAHIKNLRSKLKEVRPDQDPIVTHRGIGYSLKEPA